MQRMSIQGTFYKSQLSKNLINTHNLYRKHLSCIITLKTELDANNQPTMNLHRYMVYIDRYRVYRIYNLTSKVQGLYRQWTCTVQWTLPGPGSILTIKPIKTKVQGLIWQLTFTGTGSILTMNIHRYNVFIDTMYLHRYRVYIGNEPSHVQGLYWQWTFTGIRSILTMNLHRYKV